MSDSDYANPSQRVQALRDEFDKIEAEEAEASQRYREQLERYGSGDPAVQAATEQGKLLSRGQLNGDEEVDLDGSYF